jgi:uncharacterized protein (DUF1330 family)
MKAYVILQAEILDADRYEQYKVAVSPNIASAGVRYLVRGDNPQTLEGDATSNRLVILEFPSRQAATHWFRSVEYSEIKKLRSGAAHATVVLVDEYE